MAKRARELALQEKRERKRQKKAEAAQRREAQSGSAAIEQTDDRLDAAEPRAEAAEIGDSPAGNDDS
jgi:hypothetical protein